MKEPNYWEENLVKTPEELLPEARKAIIERGLASTSLIQRRLRIGYARAVSVMDLLEKEGSIGSFDGAKPREVLIKKP